MKPVTIDDVSLAAYRVPTEDPESDGTLEWTETTAVVAEIGGGGGRGLGYAYGAAAAVRLAQDALVDLLIGRDPLDVPSTAAAMVGAVRNLGRPGVALTAISAIDVALWDLKARLLDVPLVGVLGRARTSVDAYGSGGFTWYSREQLHDQLAAWAEAGFRMVKLKVGRDPSDDPERVAIARKAVGPDVEVFVDANGAYRRKRALGLATAFADRGVTWFEEPVPSDDLEGLRLVRDRAPAGMDVAAGEHGFDAVGFRRMLEAGAVDVLQVDATRCGGMSGFLRAGALCEAFSIPLSAHTAPTLHAHLACASPAACHVEWFHDHTRLESLLFDGALGAAGGRIEPDPSRPGLGLTLKRADGEPYLVASATTR